LVLLNIDDIVIRPISKKREKIQPA